MRCRYPALLIVLAAAAAAWGANTNNIMITGYWPPTNDMVRPFSTNPEQNPDGWIGENWEGRGYDIYSYFPEVEVGETGTGDFTVDYQDTSSDWWRIVDEVDPVAIITFSWTPGNKDWELELAQFNYSEWSDDYIEPYQPDVVPPDPDYPADAARLSTLPVQDIRNAVNDAGLGLNSYVDLSGGGNFLSGYIGYHGVWYQSMHSAADDLARCVAAGHIHVGQNVTTEEGYAATEITLRELTAYVDTIVPEPTGLVGLLALGLLRRR